MEADKAIDELQLKTGELQSIVEELKQQPDEFDVDSSVQGTNIVFTQLSITIITVLCLPAVLCSMCMVMILLCSIRILNLYAEENAIDDATYFLGEALRREAITLDVFLKVIIYILFHFKIL